MGNRNSATVSRQLRTILTAGTLGAQTDRELLQQFRADRGPASEAAFTALVERHGSLVLGVCQSVLDNAFDADDAFQATFLVLVCKASSIQKEASVASWLHGVALRVAYKARARSARRRALERRAAETAATRAEPPTKTDSLAPVVHEEVERLPPKYRAPIVLCYLEGFTHERAAESLGWPIGTVRGRLARARDILRERLTRRGLALPGGLAAGTGVVATNAIAAPVPRALSEATVRAGMETLKAGGAAVAARSPAVGELLRGGLPSMAVSKLEIVVFALLIGGALSVSLVARAGRTTSDKLPKPPAAAAETPKPRSRVNEVKRSEVVRNAAETKSQKSREAPPSVKHVDRLDMGRLHVGAMAEGEVGIVFHGVPGPGLNVTVDPPEFATLKLLRVSRWNADEPVHCSAILTIDTRTAGQRSGSATVRLGSLVASIPIVASVLPEEPKARKILVISSGFGSASDKSSYYRPWFELIDSEHLDVSYRENLGDMLVRPERDKLGNRILPKKLARFDVILLAEGWTDHISDNIIYYLNEFVKSGKRLIVTAAPGRSNALRGANPLLEPYGMRLVDDQWNREVDAKRTIFDPLATSVRTLGFYHPAGIEILDPSVATILAPAPTGKSGLVAVARPGKGEVVAIGLSFVSSWLGEEAEGFDNVQMLRNLLTKDVKQ